MTPPRNKKATTLRNIDLGAIPDPIATEAPLLSIADMKEIEAQAVREVQEELRAKMRSDYLEQKKLELKKKALFIEGKNDKGNIFEKIFIDLPKFSDRITTDGTVYFHGKDYTFNPTKAATIRDIIYRQWLHHAEINGLDMNELFGRKKYHSTIRPQEGA